ncbi:MAG: DUF1592 domain-containing protein [Planctomycetales bacterium]|nr:DUF1592 domain-containing protein [Planctomycetales bacterium]
MASATWFQRIGALRVPVAWSMVCVAMAMTWEVWPLIAHAESATEAPADSEAARGKHVWTQACAECHGALGEGATERYERPLTGDWSIAELARYIDESMPAEAPEACVGADAEAVASYLYHAFYSREAAGRQPIRRDLVHLTNRQLRESLTDLFASFVDNSEAARSRYEPGLRGEYFQSEKMNKKKESKLRRVDAAIDFDFGADAPVDGMGADAFCIAWDGSISAPDTGVYQFRITTPNGARLYVNADLKPGDQNRRDDSDAPSRLPLIDAWVSEGPQVREITASVFLLGGRRYPIRLDYFKYQEPAASIRLEWKTPLGVWEVLRGDALGTTQPARVFVAATTLPPDDRSMGYERGIGASEQWLAGVVAAAQEAAEEAVDRIDSLAPKHGDREASLREFAQQFVERAWRRPLGPEERRGAIDDAFSEAESLDLAVRRVVLRALASPHFLYPALIEAEHGETWNRAAQLALTLWDSLPDASLRMAAQENRLQSDDDLATQARRMLDDPRAHAKVRAFFHHWLETDEPRDLAKDPAEYPEFN